MPGPLRLLLDECAPRKLRRVLPGYEVSTISEMGWRGKFNGELMHLAGAAGFAALITVDKNLRFQQHLPTYPLALIVFEVIPNRWPYLVPYVPDLLALLPAIEPGRVYILGPRAPAVM